MTKQKKHKKRVRAAMEEARERYTAINAKLDAEPSAPDDVDATITKLVEARETGVGAVSNVLRDFQLRHHPGREWVATLGSHVVEHLWPSQGRPPETDRLRELLTGYRTNAVLPATYVARRSREHLEAFKTFEADIREQHKMPPMDWTPTPGDEDDAYYDVTQPVVTLGPAELGGLTPDQVLCAMWEYAPDVNFMFGLGMSKVYGWDRDNREDSDEPRQGGASLITQHGTTGSSVLKPRDDGSLVVSPATPAATAPDDLSDEAQRLRKKLSDSGIDPDS